MIFGLNINKLANQAKEAAGSWFTTLGKEVLERLYQPEITGGTKDSKGTLVKEFEGVYKKSPLANEDFRHALYHQPDRSSITKAVKALNRWMRGDPIHTQARRDYLTLITSLVWALQDKASKNGDGFSRGSFKIVDPQGKLFDFLKGYVQFATGKEKVGFLTSSNDFAYNRDPASYLSSHYTTFETEQYGIDIRFSGAAPTLNILPNTGDSHLLFGRVKIQDQWYTILKAEPIGLGHPLEYLEHGKNYLFGDPSHGDEIFRRENDIPKPIKDVYHEFHTSHYAARKPATTISDMYQEIKLATELNDKATKAKECFMNTLAQYRFAQDAPIRTGNEVIIDLTSYGPPLSANHSIPPAQVKTFLAAPNLNPNWKISALSGLSVAMLGAMLPLSIGTGLSALAGFTIGYFTTQELQKSRNQYKLEALKEFEVFQISKLENDEKQRQTFELGVKAAGSIGTRFKSLFWPQAYTNAKAYYAGMAAEEFHHQELIDKVPVKLTKS